ncbi:MAG: DUF4153 domain-containing protein [Qipengyuania sp.]|jgi:hypothetical protein|nr:DUF4153 domain-containing protein [Qipengyuania sp.]
MGGEPQDWPLRPWLLAALLGVAGLLIYHIGGGRGPDTRVGWQAAVTAFLFFGPLAFAFTLERDRCKEPLAFALVVGLVMAGLAWRAVGQGESIADPQYGFLAGLVATGLALPLFQAGFHRTRWATPYRTIHEHVWSDAICAAGSLAFVGASWLMLLLLAELFHLLKIDVLRELIDDGWFGWSWSGAAFGAALGVLRNELGIIGTLRRVAMTVLSLLAVPLAAGLALFLMAMAISGPEVLWEATRSATPVLLACAAGAWVLANAILRDEDASMSGNRVLRIAGLVLVLSILPLTVFAAVSMGTRVAQHGLSPERLWGVIAIAVAVAYGLAWLVAVVRGWKAGEWRERVRRANLHLAVVICGLALFLALPILDFGAISARQQIARLQTGAVSADKFDYDALRWDFGVAGRRALTRLVGSGNPKVARLAKSALAQQRRAYGPIISPDEYRLRVQPNDPELRRLAIEYFQATPIVCFDECVVIELGKTSGGGRRVAIVQNISYHTVVLGIGRPGWRETKPELPVLKVGSKVEIRELTKRFIVVDGKPLDRPLDDEPSPLEGAPPSR